MRNKKENELIWEAFSTSQVQEEGLFSRKKTREMYGTSTQGDKNQLRRDDQHEKGLVKKKTAENAGVADAFTSTMDDYGYSDDDYKEALTSQYHPDNIERTTNPAHNYIRRPGVSDNYSEEDVVLDHNGRTVKRKDINGGRDRIVKDASQHDRQED